jgi:hypothetical protein
MLQKWDQTIDHLIIVGTGVAGLSAAIRAKTIRFDHPRHREHRQMGRNHRHFWRPSMGAEQSVNERSGSRRIEAAVLRDDGSAIEGLHAAAHGTAIVRRGKDGKGRIVPFGPQTAAIAVRTSSRGSTRWIRIKPKGKLALLHHRGPRIRAAAPEAPHQPVPTSPQNPVRGQR